MTYEGTTQGKKEQLQKAVSQAKSIMRRFSMRNVNGFERAILLGSGTFLLLVLGQNIAPYAEFTNGMVVDGVARLPLIGGIFRNDFIAELTGLIVGSALFISIQCAEVLPKVIRAAGSSSQYQAMETLAGGAYVLDVLACLHFWPPLTVSWAMFWMAPNISSIDWRNLTIGIITVFGASLWMSLFVKFSKD